MLPPADNVPWIIATPDAAPVGYLAAKNSLNIWLIVMGSIYLFFSVSTMGTFCVWDDWDEPKPKVTITLLHTLWCTAWIIYGGYILFTDTGKTCHHSSHPGAHTTYNMGLAAWILMLIAYPGLFLCILYVSDI